MSDQQAAMAMQNPQMAQQFAMQNPELAQQAMMQNPQLAQIAPGAMAAATSGMNAPNVSPPGWTPDPRLQPLMQMGRMGQGMMQRQQGALAPAMGMMPRGPTSQIGQMAQQMPGVLMQVRPSRIL